MDSYLVTGGNKLAGSVNVQISKNAVLPMLAACLLTEERTGLFCPDIADVAVMKRLLAVFGKRTEGKGLVFIEGEPAYAEPSASLCSALRASVFLLGASLARFGRACLPLPGGCAIGKRPIDLHLSAFRALGVEVREGERAVECRAVKKRGGKAELAYPSVGATENLMLYAATAEGETVIRGCAKEPEIVDLGLFLISMGAKISGLGTDTIVVDGQKKLHGTKYRPSADRIECGTFLVACALLGGEITLLGARLEKNDPLKLKLLQNGCKIWAKDDKITIQGGERLAFSVKTGPYPSFATDLQPMMGALACRSKGESVVEETVFEHRFAYLKDLKKMGADVCCKGNAARIRGGRLHGEKLNAKDLRGGAALVLAGLAAEGVSEISQIHYIDRGYADFDKKLSLLGARIERIAHE